MHPVSPHAKGDYRRPLSSFWEYDARRLPLVLESTNCKLMVLSSWRS